MAHRLTTQRVQPGLRVRVVYAHPHHRVCPDVTATWRHLYLWKAVRGVLAPLEGSVGKCRTLPCNKNHTRVMFGDTGTTPFACALIDMKTSASWALWNFVVYTYDYTRTVRVRTVQNGHPTHVTVNINVNIRLCKCK